MNRKQIAILIIALVITALILGYDLPLEFPMIIAKVLLLFVKISIVLALTGVAYVFAGGKEKNE